MKSERNWEAYRKLRNKYWYEVNFAKRNYLSSKILSHKKDTKFLFKLVTDLTGCTAENPMPMSYKNEELSEIFADFFISKITTIRDGLKTFPKFKDIREHDNSIPILNTFRIVNQLDVKSEIDRME